MSGRATIPSFAARIGLTPAHAAAARRVAARKESSGDYRAALEAWTLCLCIEPTDQLARHGASRCIGHVESGWRTGNTRDIRTSTMEGGRT